MPIGTYRDIEQGRTSDPPFSAVQRLAAAFGKTCGDFESDAPVPNKPPVAKPRGRPRKEPAAEKPAAKKAKRR
jgi:hypothetical protein